MSRCELLADALAQLRGDLRCYEIPDDRSLRVSTGRFFADGEAVEVVVRPANDGDGIVVGDAGSVAARLDLEDVDVSRTKTGELWRAVRESFGVGEINGRIYVRGPVEDAAELIARVADAVLSLDSVRHAATAPRAERFDKQVRNWLAADVGLELLPNAEVPTSGGDSLRVTAVVRAPAGREVAVVTASGSGTTTRRAATEHAFFVFNQIADEWPLHRRLTLLDGPASDYRPQLIRALLTESYVGTYAMQGAVSRFLTGEDVPAEHSLLPPEDPTLPEA